MPRVVKIIKNASVKFGTLADPIVAASLDDFGCQVTEARVTATANATDVPATFCEPASSINVPSSFTLELNGLQDWGEVDGLSEYLFVNDAVTVAFALYLEGETVPSVTGPVSLSAGDFGGVAGEPLVFTGSYPIQGKPTIIVEGTTPLATVLDASRASRPSNSRPRPTRRTGEADDADTADDAELSNA